MERNYWSNILAERISRRRAVAFGATTAAAAALLAACGGGSSSSGNASSLLTKPVDSSKQAKMGGVGKSSKNPDALSWDPLQPAVRLDVLNTAVYDRITRIKAGYQQRADGSVVPDLAESWEFSPDRLSVTFKMRQNVVWHNIAPVNGRQFEAQDVISSWNRFVGEGTARANFANSISPYAPIVSLASPDKFTVTMKLAFPMANLPSQLSANQPGTSFDILPRESAAGQFDIRRQAIGTGPFQLEEHTPSVRIVLKRNPNFFEKDGPFVDKVEYPIVTEYATGLAQLRAGNLYTYGVSADDILPTKRDVPQMLLYQGDISAVSSVATFGYRPTDAAPFRDQRLRQAFSMSWDRDLFINVYYNVDGLVKEGLDVQTRWNSAIPANYYEGWWLNPQSKDFGGNAKYYEHNVVEAKKLMAAAGYPNGIEVITNEIGGSEGGLDYAKNVEVLEGFGADAGFRYKRNIVSGYMAEFIPKFRDSNGDFDGMVFKLSNSNPADGIEMMAALFSKAGGAPFLGMDPDGKGTFAGDPYIEDQIQKARTELDINKARSIVYDLQRYVAEKMYFIRLPGGASNFLIAWPVLKNFNVYQNERRPYFYEWLDPNEAPLKST